MKSFAFDDLDNLLNGVLQALHGGGDDQEEDPYKLLEEAPRGSQQPTGSFGGAVLANAKADLGVHEDLGKNDGKRIREYFKYFNMSAGQDWCAAAVSAWMREAGGGPITGGVGVLNTVSQFSQIGKWVPRDKITPQAMTPGNIVAWRRGGPDSGKGHIGVLESFDGRNSFTSIEANSGPRSDAVVQNSHTINDSNFLGVGILSDYIPDEFSGKASVRKAMRLADRYYLISQNLILGPSKSGQR